MQYGSLFSGIGGFDLALERAGFTCAWQCEIDKACQSVLRKHFNARIYDDVRAINRNNAEPVDLICGGFPCQDLSIAGKRAGLAGERSGLWFEFARIIEEFSPGWVLIENVPGLLSSNGGRDFAVILDGLVKFGYGVGWRVLDAQYFGVAQRRRRVFIVGSLGSGRAAEVLFERESSPGDTAPSRETGERVASPLNGISNRTGGNRPPGTNLDTAECLVTATLRGFGHGWQGQHNDTNAVMVASETGQGYWMPGIGAIRAEGENRPSRPSTVVANWQSGGGKMDDNIAASLRSGAEHSAQFLWEMNHASDVYRDNGNISPTLQERMGTGGNQVPLVGVRRLTPIECERLQGFPDGWTAGQSDSARYRQLGNAVAVPVVEWIVRRIADAR